MSLNAAEIAAVVGEVRKLLTGSIWRSVREIGAEAGAWQVELRSQGSNHHLLIQPAGIHSRFHLCESRRPAPREPSATAMRLRGLLEGARCLALLHDEGERAVRFDLQRGDTCYSLIAELFGRHGNLHLIDSDGLLVTSTNAKRAAIRGLAPGQKWVPAASVHKYGRVTPAAQEPPGAGASARIAARYDERLRREREHGERSAVLAQIRRALKRERRRVKAVEGDLERAGRATELRRRGELLQGAWGRVQRGAASVDVIDYHDPEQRTVTVTLDPALSLQEQIEKLFRAGKRLEAARAGIEARLDTARQRLSALTAAEAAAADCDVAALPRLVAGLGMRGRAVATSGRRRKQPTRRCYRHFSATDGTDILVGRGGADNDRLTFQVAKGNDIWMHARDFAGAHVVVRGVRGQPPSQQTLVEAAALAAHYSKGASDTSVDVGYTARKHVSRVKGAAPGRVSVAAMKTITIRPNPALVSALPRPDRAP